MKKKPFDHQSKEFKEHGMDHVRAIHWEQGCVSGDTEYLSPNGWRRIDSYKGGKVAQWDQKTGQASFVHPNEYVVKPCQEMIRIKTKYGVDMKLSKDHRIPYLTKHGKKPKETSARLMMEDLLGSPSAFRHLPSTFILPGEEADGTTGLSLCDLRLQVAVMADGHFQSKTTRCVIRVKKKRKIERLVNLLLHSGRQHSEDRGLLSYQLRKEASGFHVFSFYAPLRLKKYPKSWGMLNPGERACVRSEVFHWDGSRGKVFFSVNEQDADVVQTLIAAEGRISRKRYGNKCWEVHVRNEPVSPFTVRSTNFSLEATEDGNMYCFCVPTEFLVLRRNGCIFPSGNTGKTYLALWEAEALYRAGAIDAMFVVAPNGLHSNWVNWEIPELLEIPHSALAYESKKAKTKKHQNAINELLNFRDGLPILAMAYDAIKRDTGKKVAKTFLTKRKCFYVADESNRFKTPGAKVTRTVVASGNHAQYKRTLCGTPITNTPFDIYTQFRFLNPHYWTDTQYGLASYEAFKTMFGIWEKGYVKTADGNGREFPQCVGYKNLEILSDLVSFMSSRVLKEDVLDLPPKLYSYKGFDMTPKQVQLYISLKEDLMAELENGEIIFTPLAITKMLRLQQVSCGYLPSEDGETCHLIEPVNKNPRLKLLNEITQDLPHKAIIWARFLKDLELIQELLGEKAVRWDGTVPTDEREENKRRFKQCPVEEVQWMLATPDSMGEGHTLTEAATNIYYSNSYKMKERIQSEDRSHRPGQNKSLHIIDLVANNSEDIPIIDSLRKKFDDASMVIDKKYRKWLLHYDQHSSIL